MKREGNLYIGTSAAEVLHYFLIPPADEQDQSQQFILATRLQPQFAETIPVAQRAGIQQILILPEVSKACILCNNTLTFYALPELSPIFTRTDLKGCLWVGGVDLGGAEPSEDNQDGTIIMICQRSKTRLIRIGERLRQIREIDVGGYVDTIRRGSIACVADTKAYHLLDVVERQRIPLFDISTLGGGSSSEVVPASDSARSSFEATRSAEGAAASSNTLTAIANHGRNISDSSTPSEEVRRTLSPQPPRTRAASIQADAIPPRRSSLQIPSHHAPNIHTRTVSQDTIPRSYANALFPHIASTSSSEFLLTTGTSFEEPGVGLFVNLDGDVVRGTLEFSRYPDSLCVDSQEVEDGDTVPEQDQFALAVITTPSEDGTTKLLEIHNLEQDTGTVNSGKFWLHLADFSSGQDSNNPPSRNAFGLRTATNSIASSNTRVADFLVLQRFNLPHRDSRSLTLSATMQQRQNAEVQFVRRLSSVTCKILVWSNNSLWWEVRNPAIVRLHYRLSKSSEGMKISQRIVAREVLGDILGEEPKTELEFLTLRSVRQTASIMLFLDLLVQAIQGERLSDEAREVADDALAEGEVDPRLVLAVMPVLHQEIIEGADGIWVSGAIKSLLDDFNEQHGFTTVKIATSGGYRDLLQLLRRYLLGWRRKKGFGSIADEKEVFQTVDAALLHVLLLLDADRPKGPSKKGSVRAELNAVVDHGIECFDRAVKLFEQFQRLYVLSRLYQSRKQSSKVLSIWKRILDGEHDAGGELVEGEQEMRRYLTVVSDVAIVQEYGTWLAARNPKLGVRVFADANSKVKFEPKQAVEILKQHAPNAVKDYLEYLVFDKNVRIQLRSTPTGPQLTSLQLATHATDLINYYLDTVLTTLSASSSARSHLLDSYTSYRALSPPKPTYAQFAANNALDTGWWRARLRLLQLLGGSHGAASQYDIPDILIRLAPYSNELVPESIVLCGRQGKHREAIRLLVHGLGDYDTAVRYCLLDGMGTYSPSSIASVSQVLSPESCPASTSSTSITTSTSPSSSRSSQTALFSHLLEELLRLPDISDQLAQTTEVLERFAAWFDVEQVLNLVPDGWSVDKLAVFFQCSLRQLVVERNETAVARALEGVRNEARRVLRGFRTAKREMLRSRDRGKAEALVRATCESCMLLCGGNEAQAQVCAEVVVGDRLLFPSSRE